MNSPIKKDNFTDIVEALPTMSTGNGSNKPQQVTNEHGQVVTLGHKKKA